MSTIRGKLTRSLVVAVLLVGSVTFAAIFALTRSRLIQQFDVSLRTAAESVAALVQVDHGKMELDERDESMTEFRRQMNPSYFEVYDEAGESLVRSSSLKQAFDRSIEPTFAGRPVTLPDGRSGRVVVLMFTPHLDLDDGQPLAMAPESKAVFLAVARDTVLMSSTLRWMGLVLVGSLLAMVGIIALLIPSIAKRTLQPLDDMSQRAGRLHAGNLAERFSTSVGPAELLPISQALNQSLDRIEEAFTRERRFASNAAHELRTPLAAIRANAEVALKWPDPQQTQSSLSDILAVSVRMHRLVERLLELARLTQEPARPPIETVPLASLLRGLVTPSGANLGPIELRLDESVQVQTQPELLSALISNLLNNAMLHRPEGSQIVIELGPTRPVTLSISNAAPALAAEDLSRIFDPLWTKSPDRSAGHAGMGLAIAVEYARELGVCLQPELIDEKIFTMRIIFDDVSQ